MAMVELEPVLSEEMINETAFHHMADLEAHGRVDVMADMTGFDIERLHILITPPRAADGIGAGQDDSRRLEDLGAEIPQGDAGRVPPRPEGIAEGADGKRPLAGSERSQCRRIRCSLEDGFSFSDGQDYRFSRVRAQRPQLRSRRRARQELRRVHRSAPRAGDARPGGALHELRHSLLPRHRLGRAGHAGLPGQQPDPGLERPRLQRQLGRGRAQPALDQQFPGSHRPRLSGAVRGVLHAEHPGQSGHHQDRSSARSPTAR